MPTEPQVIRVHQPRIATGQADSERVQHMWCLIDGSYGPQWVTPDDPAFGCGEIHPGNKIHRSVIIDRPRYMSGSAGEIEGEIVAIIERTLNPDMYEDSGDSED